MNIPVSIVLIVKRDKIGGIHMKKLVIGALIGIGVISSLGFVSGKEKETGTVANVSYVDTLQGQYVDDNGNGVCDHYENRVTNDGCHERLGGHHRYRHGN